mmetsp:Transcript_12437/g.14251  ORF Transcript_12437/g.14251 Transcript_12437/m.14251 type:complete len:219 (-) Transcript_12437:661-1317(-)
MKSSVYPSLIIFFTILSSRENFEMDLSSMKSFERKRDGFFSSFLIFFGFLIDGSKQSSYSHLSIKTSVDVARSNWSLHSILLQNLSSFFRQVLGVLDVVFLELPLEVFVVLSCEGELACEQFVQTDASRPSLHFVRIVRHFDDELGSHVIWSPTVRRQLLVRVELHCKAKVEDLDHSALSDEDVFKLDIPVANVLRVQVIHAFDYLLENLLCFLLFQS